MSDSALRVPEPSARVTDEESSHLAALIASRSAAEVERAVLTMFANAPAEGLIDDQVEIFYEKNWAIQGWPYVDAGTPRKRRSDLKKAGLVRKSPEPRRKNRNGIKVTVYEITPAGRDALEAVSS